MSFSRILQTMAAVVTLCLLSISAHAAPAITSSPNYVEPVRDAEGHIVQLRVMQAQAGPDGTILGYTMTTYVPSPAGTFFTDAQVTLMKDLLATNQPMTAAFQVQSTEVASRNPDGTYSVSVNGGAATVIADQAGLIAHLASVSPALARQLNQFFPQGASGSSAPGTSGTPSSTLPVIIITPVSPF